MFNIINRYFNSEEKIIFSIASIVAIVAFVMAIKTHYDANYNAKRVISYLELNKAVYCKVNGLHGLIKNQEILTKLLVMYGEDNNIVSKRSGVSYNLSDCSVLK